MPQPVSPANRRWERIAALEQRISDYEALLGDYAGFADACSTAAQRDRVSSAVDRLKASIARMEKYRSHLFTEECAATNIRWPYRDDFDPDPVGL